MNPELDLLQPYPLERQRLLNRDVVPPAGLREIRLSIGEPQHETPALIQRVVADSLAGLANYPATAGT